MSQELFDEAIRLEEEGDNASALALWRQITETSPTHNAFLRLGRITKELGLFDDAEQAFQRALEIKKRSPMALIGLGNLAIHQRNYDAAADYLKRACELKEDPIGYTLLGVALKNTGDLLNAEDAYRSAIRLDPEYSEAYYNLGVLLRLDDRPVEAEACLRAALEMDPASAPTHRELGYVLMRRAPSADAQAHFQKAQAHLQKAIELDPRDSWAHIYLGTYFWQREEIAAAVAEFQVAQQIHPKWSVPLWSLGNLYLSSEDLDLAQSLFERALQLEADDWAALQGLAVVFKRRGQNDLAKEYVTRALQQDPQDEESLALLNEIDRGAGTHV